MFNNKTKEQRIADARAEMKKLLNDFLEGKGRLPEGFSAPYNRIASDGDIIK